MSTPETPDQPPVFIDGSASERSLRNFAAGVIRERLTRMLAPLQAVRIGEETEPLKQMRVWSRRSRSAMETFAACFPGKSYDRLQFELKQITRTLGAARDLDVMISTLQKREETLPEDQRGGLEEFLKELHQERVRHQKSLVVRTTDLEQSAILERFDRIAEEPESRGRKGVCLIEPKLSLRVNAARVMRHRLSEMQAYAPELAFPEHVLELHAMRIAGKQLRYTMELFQTAIDTIFPDRAPYDRALQAVRLLQDHLGEIHDADVLTPILTGRVYKLLKPGRSRRDSRHPVIGVHQVHFNACLGLLTLCREAAQSRHSRFHKLQADWIKLEEEKVFANFLNLLVEAEKADNPTKDTITDSSSSDSAVETPPEVSTPEDSANHLEIHVESENREEPHADNESTQQG